ncbi:hypothetical protein MKX01_013811 [Papaver californicum]|nr:hypothetical protein MKX01_013811 [Papaver californicum]
MRPKPNTSSQPVHTEIETIRQELKERVGLGNWRVEYEEGFPQQVPRTISCGVYSLKFIEKLIRGIELSRISKSAILQYGREIAIQLYKKKFIEVNIPKWQLYKKKFIEVNIPKWLIIRSVWLSLASLG